MWQEVTSVYKPQGPLTLSSFLQDSATSGKFYKLQTSTTCWLPIVQHEPVGHLTLKPLEKSIEIAARDPVNKARQNQTQKCANKATLTLGLRSNES